LTGIQIESYHRFPSGVVIRVRLKGVLYEFDVPYTAHLWSVLNYGNIHSWHQFRSLIEDPSTDYRVIDEGEEMSGVDIVTVYDKHNRQYYAEIVDGDEVIDRTELFEDSSDARAAAESLLGV